MSLRTFILHVGFAASLLLPAFAQNALAPITAHVASHPKGRLVHTADLGALRKGANRDLPIGVFDSGIGGLTVLEALLTVDGVDNRTMAPKPDGVPDFAGERFIYLGDQANMPYGNYASVGKTDLLRELILKDVVFLLGRRYRPGASAPARFDKPPVKAIVIACNTATAYGLADIRAALKGWGLDIPVIGVVDAGAEAVAELLPASGPAPSVGVMATVGTCASGAYPAAIAAAAERAGKGLPAVVQQGSVGLAGAIEGNPAFVTPAAVRPVPYQGPEVSPELAQLGGLDRAALLAGTLNTVPDYVRFDVASLVSGFRAQHPQAPPLKLVVLGCTHFPLVGEALQDAFRRTRAYQEEGGERPFAGRVAEEVILVNPAEHAARAMFKELAARKLRRAASARRTPKMAGFYLTVPNPASPGIRLGSDGGLDNGYRLGRSPGSLQVEDTSVVPLTPKTLPESSRGLVKALPAVWKALEGQRGN